MSRVPGPGGKARDSGIEVRREVRPRWRFALPLRSGLDGLTRARGGVLHRLIHAGEQPVLVRVAQLSADRVLFGARAPSREAAEWGIERMRLALGIDQDLSGFYDRFRFDPLIGRSVQMSPGLRASGKPDPFEALAREVASGRVDLHDPSRHERDWRRLRAIREIGSWTVQMLGFTGQGRLDQLPAADLAYLKLVGRLRSGGDQYARATEAEVDEFFAPYAPWAGLAGLHALRAA